MAKIIEVQQDHRMMIVSNEPVCYPNEGASLLKVSFDEYERLASMFGGPNSYGISWYFFGLNEVKYFDSKKDRWDIVRSPVTPRIVRRGRWLV